LPPPTLKFRDDGGGTPNKAVDDVKLPLLDDPNLGKAQQDLIDPAGRVTRPAPFVLATPHHSMAWAQDQPAALEAAVAQLESDLTQLSTAIAEREEADRQSQLSAEESDELKQLRADYEALLTEYEQLIGGAT